MKQVHHITISVYLYENEDQKERKKEFASLFPFAIDKLIQEKSHTGLEDEQIRSLEVVLSKQSDMKKFLELLFDKLPQDQIRLLKTQASSRIDDHAHFYIRLAKESISTEKWLLTETGKCVHIKIKVAAFPAVKENVLKVVLDLVQSYVL